MTAASMDGLRRASRIALVVGAAGSLGLMLYAGRHNKHLLITALFIVWVLAPFAGLALADRLSPRWPATVRRTLQVVMLLTALVSLVIYVMNAIWPRQQQAAFVYVAVPPASVLASALILGASALVAKDRSRGDAARPGIMH
jgi:hypothetical protein